MVLFRRLPIGRVTSWPIVASDEQGKFPALSQRFADANDVIGNEFGNCDRDALRSQQRFRQVRVLLLVFASLTAVSGTLQVAYQDESWPGVAIAITGLVATALAHVEGRSRPGPRYLAQRARAEELRSLYFRYLAGEGSDDRRWLEKAVADIVYPGAGAAE